MKEAINIIRHQWRAVGVILALSVLFTVLNFEKSNPKTHPIETCAVFIVGMTAFTAWMIVSQGFFRGIATNPLEVRRIPDLLSIGKGFFWRYLGLGLLFVIALLALSYACFLILKISLSFAGYALDSFLQGPWWAKGICFTLAASIIVIPQIIAQALIVVRDCDVGKSLKGIFKVKLANSNIVMIAIAAVLLSSWSYLLPADKTVDTVLIRAIRLLHNIIWQLAYIIIEIIAVRLVTVQMGLAQRSEPLPKIRKNGLLKQ